MLTKTALFALSVGTVAAAGAYQQCGGTGWSGDPACPSGYYCYTQNAYYSQCIPGSGGSGSTTTRPTTTTTTTTTTRPITTTGGAGCTNTVTATVTNTVTANPVTVTVTQGGGGSTTTRTTTTTTRPISSTTTTTTRTTTAGTSPTAVAGGTAYPPTGGSSVSGNPYAGMPRYVNVRYDQQVAASIANSSDSTFKAAATKLRNIPTFVWFDTMSTIPDIAGHLAAADAQSGGKPIVAEFVIYDLPGRDCHAFASNGEIPAGGINTYKTQYIDPIVVELSKKPSHVRLVLVIEPDSLPNLATNIGLMQCNSTSETEYMAGVAYAIAKLSAIPNTYLYIDAAHGGWLGWPDNQTKMATVFKKMSDAAKAINPSATFRGWASNTANYSAWDGKGACPAKQKCPLQNGMYDYNPCIDEKLFIAAMNKVFSAQGLPTKWIHDSSRNGVAGIRTDWGSWCNIKGAGVGNKPTSEPATDVDAFVWVKPPGESDGVSGPKGTVRLDDYCDPTTTYGQDSLSEAPQAGKWFDAQFQMLVKNANPAL